METQEIQEVKRNERGEIGIGTPGLNIKRRWRLSEKAFHKASLKRFARDLAGKGDEMAKKWLASKKGAFNLKRSDKNEASALAARQASKAARKGKK